MNALCYTVSEFNYVLVSLIFTLTMITVSLHVLAWLSSVQMEKKLASNAN